MAEMDMTPEATDMAEPNLAEVAEEAGNFTTLLTVVASADPAVLEALTGEDELTVFAPDDTAFNEAIGTLTGLGIDPMALLSQPDVLTEILLFHVVEGELLAEDILEQLEELDAMDATMEEATEEAGEATEEAAMDEMMEENYITLETAAGLPLYVRLGDDGDVELSATEDFDTVITVTATDIQASNGVIHVIDGVLLPPGLVEELLASMAEEEATPEATATN
jgi:uncharacterized surface protein with fasciclin (FAS1) repeats